MTEGSNLRAFGFDWASEPQSGALEGLLTTRVLHLKVICPHTSGILDLTDILQTAVRRGGVQRGIAHLQLTHGGAALLLGVPSVDTQHEYLNFLSSGNSDPIPWPQPRAAEDQARNSRDSSGLPSPLSVAGVALALQVEDSKVMLGDDQRILLAELAGGQERSIRILLMGV